MKKFIILSLFVFFSINCKQKSKQKILQYDTELIAIIDNSKSDLLNDTKKADLTSEDINQIDQILTSSILDYNLNAEKTLPELRIRYVDYKLDKNSVHIKLENYKRQYIPYTNSEGEKEVWIYCTISNRIHSNWKRELLFAAGGGDNYFQLTVNLSNKIYRDFAINGPA